jgi:hypothetical protein
MPALATLRRVVTSGESDTVALQAARYVLEVNGFKPTDKVEQATAISIQVSYADQPQPWEISRTRQNGKQLTNGR